MHDLILKITDIAKEDMNSIFSFIAKDNETAAKKLFSDFYRTYADLLRFPKSGYVYKRNVKHNIRVYIIAKHYKIFYYVKNNKLFIQRVLTGYQDIFSV